MVEEHLTLNGSSEWVPTIRALRPYLRRHDSAAWSEFGVISAKRWKHDVQYQAVRRLLAERLGLDQKLLRRRFDEIDHRGGSCQSLLTILLHFLYLEMFKKATVDKQ